MELQGRLLEESRQHFRRQAEKMVSDCDLASYMKLAAQILAEERKRFTTYLTWDKSTNVSKPSFKKKS